MSAVLDGAPLQPVCETAIRRLALDLPLAGGGRAELALDQGEIRAGEIALPFREAELELKAGRAADLYLLARDLFADGGVEFSTMTKAARGYMLAETGRIAPPIAPRTARRVEIAPDQSSETAARDILRECFDQVATNVLATRRIDDPEGPHQLRVGLRRLRSALSALRPVVGGAESARLGDEARWLGQEAGRLRDLDVALADILAPEIAAHPGEPGFPTLRAAVAARRDRVRADLRAVLDGGRVTAFQLDLARFVETRGWLDPADYGQTDRLSRPAAEMAREALDRRWKKVTKRARDIETLDIPARHELRKELKKLRYAVEFMAPLYAEKKVRAFLKRLKRLQDVFGALNDAAMAEALFVGAEAPGAGDPDAQRAAGRVLGARAERAETQWHEARALWRALAEAGPFWR
jgi:inorganic triphosphatase YgiF